MKTLLLIILLFSTPGLMLGQPTTLAKPTNVAILLYPGVELLDFAGPLEVFSLMPNATVYTVAAKAGPLHTMKKMLRVTPDYTPDNAPQPDVLVVPGASPDYIRAVIGDSSVMNWIRATTANRQLTMSVCTGAYILGKAGLLDQKTATTHWASTDMLQQMNPGAKVMEHTRFVVDGNVVTTAGVSAGIDGALQVVEQLRGRDAAQDVARIMEYDYWQTKPGLIVGKPGKTTTQPKPKKTVSTSAPAVANPATRAILVHKAVQSAAPIALSSPIDPVCKMDVSKARPDTTQYKGKVYGFCSKICKERFHRHPGTYVP